MESVEENGFDGAELGDALSAFLEGRFAEGGTPRWLAFAEGGG